MAVRRGEVIEIDEDEDNDEGSHEMSLGSMIQLCAQMENIALSYAEPELKLGLSQTLRKQRRRHSTDGSEAGGRIVTECHN